MPIPVSSDQLSPNPFFRGFSRSAVLRTGEAECGVAIAGRQHNGVLGALVDMEREDVEALIMPDDVVELLGHRACIWA
jgi:hypothetical protein